MAHSTHPATGGGFPDALVAVVLDDVLASKARVYGIGRQALRTLPSLAGRTIRLDARRNPP